MLINKKYMIDDNEKQLQTNCNIHVIHAVIDDLEIRTSEIISTITDTSWINQLSPINQKSYNARSVNTIAKIVTLINDGIENNLIDSYGEYLISLTAQDLLELCYSHKKIPLAELFKEQLIHNPGFDYHTETHTQLILFGEAKFSLKNSPYKKALTQIKSFIDDQKDERELADLQHFISPNSQVNFGFNAKAFSAAFSLNAKRPDTVLKNALKSYDFLQLYNYNEVYLIGVTIG